MFVFVFAQVVYDRVKINIIVLWNMCDGFWEILIPQNVYLGTHTLVVNWYRNASNETCIEKVNIKLI